MRQRILKSNIRLWQIHYTDQIFSVVYTVYCDTIITIQNQQNAHLP